MKTLILEDLKELELKILLDIDKVCSIYGIRYYLAYGTLLGAIRHKGFIPWDDDIDVYMLREDYERFVKVYNNLSTNNSYKVYSCAHTPHYYYEFAKVVDLNTILREEKLKEIDGMGVYVDVFPLDIVPSNIFKKHLLYLLERIRSLSVYKTIPPVESIFMKLCLFVAWNFTRLFSSQKLALLINKLAWSKKSISYNSKLSCVVSPDMVKKTLSYSIFEKSIKVIFEGREFNAPIGWKEYLETMYGNYSELPPLENRVSNHTFIAYLID